MLEIYKDKAEYLVKVLFRLDIKSVIKIQHFFLKRNIKLTFNFSNLKFTLKNVENKVIIYILNLKIYKIIIIN